MIDYAWIARVFKNPYDMARWLNKFGKYLVRDQHGHPLYLDFKINEKTDEVTMIACVLDTDNILNPEAEAEG